MKNTKNIILLNFMSYAIFTISGCSGGAEHGIGYIPPFTISWSIASGDINGDGLLDLAVGHSGVEGAPNSITLWFQNPVEPGKFIKNTLTITYSPEGIKLADLNGDNKLDILVISGAIISIYLQDSVVNGKFPTEVTYIMPSKSSRNIVEIGDLNDDAKIDIAAVNGNGVSIFYQYPSNPGYFFPNVTILENIGVTSLAIEDLNSDGLDDISVGQYLQNKISIYTQNPSSKGSFLFDGEYSYPSPDYIALGDLNADNEPDICTTNANSVAIFFSRS